MLSSSSLAPFLASCPWQLCLFMNWLRLHHLLLGLLRMLLMAPGLAFICIYLHALAPKGHEHRQHSMSSRPLPVELQQG